jgi:Lar family restriction alleviation protein
VTTTPEPKPCPFCGGTSIQVQQGSIYRTLVVKCADCGAQAPETRQTSLYDLPPDRATALRDWNTRVNPEHISPDNPWPDIQILADGFSAALFYVLEDADLDDDINLLDDSLRMERITQAMQALTTLEQLRAEQDGQTSIELEPAA